VPLVTFFASKTKGAAFSSCFKRCPVVRIMPLLVFVQPDLQEFRTTD
jgi:hypothetical protein